MVRVVEQLEDRREPREVPGQDIKKRGAAERGRTRRLLRVIAAAELRSARWAWQNADRAVAAAASRFYYVRYDQYLRQNGVEEKRLAEYRVRVSANHTGGATKAYGRHCPTARLP